MDVPEDLLYTDQHEWVRIDGDQARVGITDYAQDALGDVVYITLPELDKRYERAAVLGEVESTKSVSEIYAPLSGTVVEVNTELESHPEKINSDPYGDGWICVMIIEDRTELEQLLKAADYEQMIGS